jgi:hypothetical protein
MDHEVKARRLIVGKNYFHFAGNKSTAASV